MTTFTYWYGAPQPIKVRGRHVCRLVQFAEKFRGWHTAKQDRTTLRALASAQRADCIEVSGDQFRFIYPSTKKELR